MSGTLPSSLGQLTLMEKIYLTNNFISGTIPPSLGNMLRLDELDFGENQLSGTVPKSLGDLPRMLRMDFDFNHLRFFPPELCTRLQSGGLRYCYMLGMILSARIWLRARKRTAGRSAARSQRRDC